MSYQVLARKWRPKSFETLVGQEHVVRALTHALQTGRLHHAYLFTGTRGVGKTTIARILAKALNCETGITPTPCAECASCKEIDAGRFVDLLEVDAATNTRVDEMRQLLENATYAPTRGRFKVYVIDEVHMLSNSAFNAMLKTLEEPPEHIKFILATTDPQKIPVTVLSRCLQFNLKQMPHGHIVDHLGRILEAEAVSFEPGALRHIARGANGSMRDALSLLDQAIAHGAGKVEEEAVQAMLGNIGDEHLYAILDALAAGDVAAMLGAADLMEGRSLSFGAALQSLATLIHRAAVLQFAPDALADPLESERLAPYAETFAPEFLQLVYQILIHGRDELAMAPDEYAGFTMTLLRLHAFRPMQPGKGAPNTGGGSVARAPAPSAKAPNVAPSGALGANPGAGPAMPVASPERMPSVAAKSPGVEMPQEDLGSAPPPWVDEPIPDAFEPAPGKPMPALQAEPPADRRAPSASTEAISERAAATAPAVVAPAPLSVPTSFEGFDWHVVVSALDIGGLVRELAQNCACVAWDGNALRLKLAPEHRHLVELQRQSPDKLAEALSSRFGRPIRLKVEIGEVEQATPAAVDRAARAQAHAEAVDALLQDPFVQALKDRFDATLVESSVKPLN